MDDTTFEVQVWGVRTYKGKRKTTYTVRWKVEKQTFQQTFDTVKLAQSFQATLLVAMRKAEPFSVRTGLPVTGADRAIPETSWLQHATAFVDMKWPTVSPRHRKGIAEGLVTATIAVLPDGGPERTLLRESLQNWLFNAGARRSPRSEDGVPDRYAAALNWATRRSPSLTQMAEPALLRQVLQGLTLTLDGKAASSSTVARKRSALYSAFDYAVETGALPSNPMARIRWKAPPHTDVVDRRVVVNPDQARRLIAETGRLYPALEAFFGCIYYGALRPSEVRHLKLSDVDLPAGSGAWGTLHLVGSTQTAGRSWTDNASPTEDRGLKHRSRRATRTVPAPPQLVALLGAHVQRFPPGQDGRLFVNRTGRAGVPLAGPFGTPQSMGVVYRVWDQARRAVLSDLEYQSPLARRPYDLRHAAVSLWLNAGVPAPQVAQWAGHSVHVLLRVYASCIVGQDEAARARVENALL